MAAAASINRKLKHVSHKLVKILIISLKPERSCDSEPAAYDIRDDFWRWRFEQGWEKSNNNLKLAQNVDHCNQVLRSSLMLLREYRGFLEFGVQKTQGGQA